MINLVKPNHMTNFKKARHLLGFLVLIWIGGCDQPKQNIEIFGKTMGTTYSIRIVPELNTEFDLGSTQSDLDSILAEIDRQMSTYRLDSEITKFNESQPGEEMLISPGFATVVSRAVHWGEVTDGALDVTILPAVLAWRRGGGEEQWMPPGSDQIRSAMEQVGYKKIILDNRILQKSVQGQMIDLNAIAKGWGVDQLFEYFAEKGIENVMVEIGGEVRTAGQNIKGKDWRIGIDTPLAGSFPGEDIYAVVRVADRAMATSGNYRNFFEYEGKTYSHIIDPRNGLALQSNISSVTVIGPTCMDADALATALNVMTVDAGLKLVESLKGFEAFWIIKEGEGQFKSVASPGMPINH